MEKIDKKAKAGFILGLVSIVAWFIPIIGFPVTVCAIVFSSLGLKSVPNHGKAVAGLILGIIFIVITMINAILGAAIGIYRVNQQLMQAQTQNSAQK